MINSVSHQILPWLSAALGITVALIGRVYILERRLGDLDHVQKDMRRYLRSADLVLSGKETPETIRLAVLIVLKTFSSRELMEDFATYLQDTVDVEKVESGPASPGDVDLMRDVTNLRVSNPALAELVQEAVFGLLLCLPTICSSSEPLYTRIERENACQGATRPSRMWSKLSGFLSNSMDNNRDPHIGGAATV